MSVLDAWFDFVQAEKISLTKNNEGGYEISSLLLASTIVLSVYFLMRAENYNVTLHLGICKYWCQLPQFQLFLHHHHWQSPWQHYHNWKGLPNRPTQQYKYISSQMPPNHTRLLSITNHYQQFLNYKIVLHCKTTTTSFHSYFFISYSNYHRSS